jgi:hypothetical protein
MSSAPRYYYVDAQNQAAGPLPLPELHGLHTSGTITDTTLVVIEGGQDWVAFSTIKPAAQTVQHTAPQATSPQLTTPAASLTKTFQAAAPASSLSQASPAAEPAWASQLLQKIDQLTLTAEKIVAALEKNTSPRPMPSAVPPTAALHAEKGAIHPVPKPGIAQLGASTPNPIPAPAAPRPGVSTPLSPMAVPANAVKPALPLPSLGKPGTPTPAPLPNSEKSGNLFSKFLKK